jgi:fused signal recognition particle receptor
MFKFLKEKLKSWAEKVSKESEKQEKKTEEKEKKKITVPIEETKEEEKKSFLKKIGKKISTIKISEKEFDVYSDELKMLLLENNVAYSVAEEIIGQLRKKIVGQEFLKKELEEQIRDAFKYIIEDILIEPFDIAEKIRGKNKMRNEPYVILFCGINGSGKTTSIAKVADYLNGKMISCVLAAADTFRAASIEQLKQHGERLRIKVIAHDYGSDPASVGFEAIKYAKKNSINCVLIDTAGRMHTAKNLLREMEKIVRVCHPDLKIFIGESITGNDAVEQAKAFNETIGIDGIILTKADIDEKGGTALSVGAITGKPILFLGTGQEYDKIEPFDKKKFVEKLGL